MKRALAVLVVAFLALSPLRTAAAAEGPDIDHVVVVVLENATFDHVFGTYPGADGLPAGVEQRDVGGKVFTPQLLRPEDFATDGPFAVVPGVEPLDNGPTAARAAFNGGAMDRFAAVQDGVGNPELTFRYADRSVYPNLWAVADESVLFDRWFSSAPAGSLPNVLDLIAGADPGVPDGSAASLNFLWGSTFPTIFDRAAEQNVSWSYYVGGLDELDPARLESGAYLHDEHVPSPFRWAPVLSMGRFMADPTLRSAIKDQRQFFADSAAGQLPAISYVLASPTTHWPTPPDTSERRIVSILDSLRKSPGWEKTAVLVVWDDWGGFYDHVPPPQLHAGGLGFRTPALLVSPQAKAGLVSSEQYDHTSVPSFIASTFGLEPLGKYSPGSFAEAWSGKTQVRPLLSARKAEVYQATGRQHAPRVGRIYEAFLLPGLLLTVLFVRRARSQNVPATAAPRPVVAVTPPRPAPAPWERVVEDLLALALAHPLWDSGRLAVALAAQGHVLPAVEVDAVLVHHRLGDPAERVTWAAALDAITRSASAEDYRAPKTSASTSR